MMNAEALKRVTDLMEELTADGFIITGELHLLRPLTLGLVRVQATTFNGQVPRVKLEVIKPPPAPSNVLAPDKLIPSPVDPALAALDVGKTVLTSMGYTGNTCPHCEGTRLVRRGTCEYCEDCATSSGCS